MRKIYEFNNYPNISINDNLIVERISRIKILIKNSPTSKSCREDKKTAEELLKNHPELFI